jgi:hypothetical protein
MKYTKRIIVVDGCIDCPYLGDNWKCNKLNTLIDPTQEPPSQCPLLKIHTDFIDQAKKRQGVN